VKGEKIKVYHPDYGLGEVIGIHEGNNFPVHVVFERTSRTFTMDELAEIRIRSEDRGMMGWLNSVKNVLLILVRLVFRGRMK
jgi:hypothetical protein